MLEPLGWQGFFVQEFWAALAIAGRDACQEFRRLWRIPEGTGREDMLSRFTLKVASTAAKLVGDGALFVLPHPETHDADIRGTHRSILATLSLFLAGRIAERFREAIQRENAVDTGRGSWQRILDERLAAERERLHKDPTLARFAWGAPLVSAAIDRGDVQLLEPPSGPPEIIGTPVNVAARLLAAGDPGTVVITDQIHPWLSPGDRELFRRRSRGIRGLPGGRGVYELRLPRQ